MIGAQVQLGRLIGAVDAGEVGQFVAPGLGVETFDVTALALGEGSVDEDFEEISRGWRR